MCRKCVLKPRYGKGLKEFLRIREKPDDLRESPDIHIYPPTIKYKYKQYLRILIKTSTQSKIIH